MAEVGYIRVSTMLQNTDRQLDGIELDEKFEDKISGKTTKRPALMECMKFLRKGDRLHVHSIDRLARNLQDLLGILNTLTIRGVSVRFHKECLEFTGDNNPTQELQLQIIGAVAQFERAIIHERQREGIEKAKAQGKHLGRAKKLSKAQEKELCQRAMAGEEKKALAKEFGISRQSLYRYLQHDEPKATVKK